MVTGGLRCFLDEYWRTEMVTGWGNSRTEVVTGGVTVGLKGLLVG